MSEAGSELFTQALNAFALMRLSVSLLARCGADLTLQPAAYPRDSGSIRLTLHADRSALTRQITTVRNNNEPESGAGQSRNISVRLSGLCLRFFDTGHCSMRSTI